VKALLEDGRYVTLPVNQETAEIVGRENILDIFFRPYTKKMWGVELEKLDPSILQRVPVRDDMNEYYFPGDTFQAMPSDGYTRLFERMLDNDRIRVKLRLAFDKAMEAEYSHVFNSMPIDEYFDYQCMVFPETTWQNNELTLTEKGLKCFYSQCLPMPVGGSNVNRLYNSLGYYTAWNLLPSQLQVYDSNKNHQERCQQQIAALAWLSKNTDVFASPESIEMKRINRNNFLSNFVDVSAVKKFDRQFFEQIHV
jgi:hypothetical protein